MRGFVPMSQMFAEWGKMGEILLSAGCGPRLGSLGTGTGKSFLSLRVLPMHLHRVGGQESKEQDRTLLVPTLDR